MKTSPLLAIIAVVASVGSAYETEINDERKLRFWPGGASDRTDYYRSIYYRCCGDTEGDRNITPPDSLGDDEKYTGSCKCPVREETGDRSVFRWNLLRRDYQAKWNDACADGGSIQEKAKLDEL
jgi:hypothetical protein